MAALEEGAVRLVGMGASAGGLSALFEFFDHLPDATQAAFVVVQHLSPDHPSMMDELLARHTRMAVAVAEDGMVPEAGHIYLIPAGCDMVLRDGSLRVSRQERTVPRSLSLPIDAFFSSLAEERGPGAVAIVLSGSGSDGSLGCATIARFGGIVMVQEPGSAAFDGMPHSVLRTGFADVVDRPSGLAARMAGLLAKGAHHGMAGQEVRGDLQPLLQVLRDVESVDFAGYKEPTLRRRIIRRLTLGNVPDLAGYTERLRTDGGERRALVDDLLIGVTSFFRDPASWELLRDRVLTEWASRGSAEEPLRVWVCACSTGEEVYTLGILLCEAFEAVGVDEPPVRIFATDLSRTALDRASSGRYPASIGALVGEERLQRFFKRVGDEVQVVPRLRRMALFARHDVVRQTPFSRMDLVTCRNMLIYLRPSLQLRALRALHFALRPDAVLFLGSAETLLELDRHFEVIDGRARLFRARAEGSARVLGLRGGFPTTPPLDKSLARSSRGLGGPPGDALLREVVDALLSRRVASGLVVRGGQLVYVLGSTPPYLRLPVGSLSSELSALLPQALWVSLHAALHRARAAGSEVRVLAVRFDDHGCEHAVDVRVVPMPRGRDGGQRELVLLSPLREAVPDQAPADVQAHNVAQEQVANLTMELRHTRESLQATVEELETTNEEHQATNEELLASNEELQSTNEELHSVNEELQTLNAEYQEKITQLLELTGDVEALLQALSVGVVFLDEQGRVLRYNQAATEVFRLAPVDVGRPLSHLADFLVDASVRRQLSEAMEQGVGFVAEAATQEGQRYSLRLDVIAVGDGTRRLLTLVDLTEVYEAQAEAAEHVQLLDSLARHLPDVLWVIAADGSYRFISDSYESLWGVSPEWIQAHPERFPELVHEDDRERVLEELATGLAGEGFDLTYRIIRPDGTMRWARGRGFPVHGSDGQLLHTVGTIQDVTAQVQARQQQQSLLERFELTMAALGEVVYDHDAAAGHIDWDGNYPDVLGYRVGMMGHDEASWLDRVHPDDLPRVSREFDRARSHDQVFELRYRFRRADGSYLWMSDLGHMQVDAEGEVQRVVGMMRALPVAAGLQKHRIDGLVDLFEQLGGGQWSWRPSADTWRVDEAVASLFDDALRERLRETGRAALYEGGLLLDAVERPDQQVIAVGLVHVDDDDRIVVEGSAVDVGAAEDQLRSLEGLDASYGAAFDHLPLAVWVVDERGKAVLVNRAASEWGGLGSGLDALHDRLFEGGLSVVREDRILEHASLGARFVRSTRQRIDDGLVLCVEQDITEQRRFEEDLRTRAAVDPLTGLWVRSRFVEQLSVLCTRATRRGERSFAVIFMDLDGFKEVNDSYDHFVGDALLVAFAQRLQSLARPGDAVARFGGDEFAVLVDQVADYRDALAVARRIHEANLAQLTVGERQFTVSASIGIALHEGDRHTPESLLRDADVAMYEAKRRTGERTVVFDARMHAQVLQRHETKRDLGEALERDEFVLHLQPICVPGGRVEGYEALIRWEHPSRGMLAPGAFLPLAKETGLMADLEAWVLNAVLGLVDDYPEVFREGAPPLLAVNATPQLLRSSTFRRWVERAGAEGYTQRAAFVVEIVEETLLSTDPAVRLALLSARQHGMRVAIDDFGTGYSSLSYLMNWPIDVLKLDGTFTAQSSTNERAVKVVGALVDLAQSLDLRTVLEGVESEAHLAFSAAVGVDYVQGYYQGRPGAPEQVLTGS